MIKKILIDGNINYLNKLRPLILLIAWLSPLSILLMPDKYKDFGTIGWLSLLAVIAIKPLSQIFVDFGILRSLIPYRKELGVFSGTMILAHFVGYLIVTGTKIKDIPYIEYFTDPKSALFWGLLGVIALLPVLLTSNGLAMKLLKENWRRIQKLVYLFFIFGAIHIVLVSEPTNGVPALLTMVIWIIAKFNFKIELIKKLK